jgi:Gpi18-like mannosyltransferase
MELKKSNYFIRLFYKKSFWLVLIIIGLIAKIALFPVETGDYIHFFKPWIQFINTHGYASSLKYNFYNYPPGYIYILIGIAKTGLNPLFFIKIISVAFEFLAAFFIGKIAFLKYKDNLVIWISLAIIPLLPTVLLNSSYLSQCDSMYASFVFGSVYFLLKNKYLYSVLFLAFAFVFKVQSVFILPLFFVVMLKGKIQWYYFLIIPVFFLLSLIPAASFGRPFTELLSTYYSQANQYRFLTNQFPNLYIWIDNQYYEIVKLLGIIVTCCITIITGIILSKKKYRFNSDMWIQLALISAIVIPFILPGMHERYMYIGDILSVLYFILFRKNIFVPIGIVSVSLYSYIRCSRFNEILPMEPAFFVYLSVIIFLIVNFIQVLKKSTDDTKL